MKMRKLSSLLLALVMLLGLLPTAALAAGGEWEGSGTEADPYILDDAADLRALAANVNGGETYEGCFFILRSDIDLSGADWTPIGGEDDPFAGMLRGRGYSITGLRLTSGNSCCGLFGNLAGTVRDLSVEVNVAGGGNTGGIAGKSSGTILNCEVSGTVSGGGNVGGIAGYSNGVLENCLNRAAVSGSGSVGGICGSVGAAITRCTNEGAVENSGEHTGGIVGHCGSGPISGCRNSASRVHGGGNNVGGVAGYMAGAVENCSNDCPVSVSGGDSAGGVVGLLEWGSVVNCLNTAKGTVSSSGIEKNHVGGVVGECRNISGATIKNCTNNAAVRNDEHGFSIGGIAGLFAGSILNCVNNGTVTGELCDDVGGIIANTLTTCSVKNCTNNAAVSGSWTVGGVAGDLYSGSYVGNCLNKGDVSASGNVPASGEILKFLELGGVVGGIGECTVENCTNTGNVRAPYLAASRFSTGGIVGRAASTTIKNCLNSNGAVQGDQNVGGIVGLAIVHADKADSGEGCTVTNCLNTGSVSGKYQIGGVVGSATSSNIEKSRNTGAVSGLNDRVGGVVGELKGNSIYQCMNSGSVKGSTKVGGIAGITNWGAVTLCQNTGRVDASNTLGGVVGQSSGTITLCGNTGRVTGSGNNVGGVAGTAGSTISNCYDRGAVYGYHYVGGLVGDLGSSVAVYDCYVKAPDTNGEIDDADGVDSTKKATFTSTPYSGALLGHFDTNNLNMKNCYWWSYCSPRAVGGNSLSHLHIGNDYKYFAVESYFGNLSNFSAWENYKNNWTITDGVAEIKNLYSANPAAATGGSGGSGGSGYAKQAFYLLGGGTEGDPYRIANPYDWEDLASFISGGGSTSGKYCKQIADLEGVTTMLGSSATPFKGSYDGQGHTLNVNISDAGAAAPFGSVSGATIKDLTVTGTVSGGRHSAGLVAGASGGDNLIENCVVSAAVATSDTYAGGFMGHGGKYRTTLRGCVFSGSISGAANGATFWGWSDAGSVPVLINCLDISESALPVGAGYVDPGADLKNVYYTNSGKGNVSNHPWSAPGRLGYTVSAGEGVTVTLGGAIGLAYGDVIYGGEGEALTLTLSGSEDGYDASAGTLTKNGNTYSLTMPAENVTVLAKHIEKYPLWVGGVQFTSDNLTVDSADSAAITGKAEYDPEVNTLTLTGFSCSVTGERYGDVYSALLYTGTDDLVIDLSGRNSLTQTGVGQSCYSAGMYFFNKCVVTIRSMDGGALTAVAGAATANGISYGICSCADLVIDGAEVTAIGGDANRFSFGATFNLSGLTLESGSLTARGGTAELFDSCGIRMASSSFAVNGGTLIAVGGSGSRASYGIGGEPGENMTLSVTGGGFVARGNSRAIENATLSAAADMTARASENVDGSGAKDYESTNNSSYKYVRVLNPVPYLDPTDEGNPNKVCKDYMVIDADVTTLETGWYVVAENVTIDGRIEIKGHVNLILTDSAVLTANNGIHLPKNDAYSLTIWARDGEGNSAYDLEAIGSAGCAGIGGNKYEAGGVLTVNGGELFARGGQFGAGVGGGDEGDGGAVTVNGGHLSARGNDGSAGVGGGDYGNGGALTVTGGRVTATGSVRSGGNGKGMASPGVGAGRPNKDGSAPRSSGVVTVTGGTLTAIAGDAEGDLAAQAIGVNVADANINGNGSADRLVIGSGMNVKASGGDDPVATSERVSACRENRSVVIALCTEHEFESGACKYCGATIVTVIPGENMTKSAASGAASQIVMLGSAMTDVVYTADDGYYFPEDYNVASVNGVTVTRNSFTQVTVSGAPTADVNITLTAPTAKTKEHPPEATFTATGPDCGTLKGVTAGMKYSVDGGSEWADVIAVPMVVTGVSAANGVRLYLPASDTNTKLDSDAQSIPVTKAATPNLAATQPSVGGGTGSIPTTAAHEISEDGTTWAACTGATEGLAANNTYYVRVKASGTALASEKQSIKINAFDPGKEQIPSATFTATGPDCGTLKGVTAGMKYSVDGGTSWTGIAGDSVELSGLSACTIMIVRLGNGTTTADSDAQTIPVTKAATPNLAATQPSVVGGTGSIPTTAAHEISEDGTTWAACTGATEGLAANNTYYVRVKASGTALASEKQSIKINAFDPGKEQIPSATFTATGPDCGTLKGVTAGMKYSVDGGTSWTGIAGDSVELSGLSACTIMIVRLGNGTTTADSDAQTIAVTKAATPVGVTAAGCAAPENDDGRLVGVTAGMEYKASGAGAWTAADGDVTGLVPGTYLVRVAAAGTVLASEPLERRIDPYNEEEPVPEEPVPEKPVPEKPGLPFIDVPEDAFYYEAVEWAYEEGIADGVTDDRFDPEGECTRAQMVVFLWRAAGKPEPKTTESPFTDVDENAYYYKAVLWAYESGITNGKSEGKFDPDGTVSRAESVTFLCRALHGKPGEENPFRDVKIGEYYYDAVLWAAANGVTDGAGEGVFCPELDCLRAHIVTFLYRAYHEE